MKSLLKILGVGVPCSLAWVLFPYPWCVLMVIGAGYFCFRCL